MSGKRIPDLSETQLRVMQILWEAAEPLKPSEIGERLERSIENATLRSVLRVLVEKGALEREKRGKAFVYSPKQEKRGTLLQFLEGLADVFASGSKTGLVAQLLQDESLTAEEIAELRRIANQAASKKGDDS